MIHLRTLHHRLCLLVCFLCITAYAQTTRNVGPGQTYTTIQSGIDAAVNGDTVLVAPGTYHEHIDFKGKAITVTSSDGAASTIIDGDNQGGKATVSIHSGETWAAVLSKLTIRGGGEDLFAGTGDGGVYIAGASPVIRDNIITANFCHNIDVFGGSATIQNNVISGVLRNVQQSYCAFRSALHFQAAWIDRPPTVVGNTFEDNLTGNAINIWATDNVLILNNTIRHNSTTDVGSALNSVNSTGTVFVNNTVYDNNSTCGGALAFLEGVTRGGDSTILIANNTLTDNISTGSGSISNCTHISQVYPSPGAYGLSSPKAILLNNIFSGSTPYPAVNCSWYGTPNEANQPTFQNNVFYNVGGPAFGDHCVDVSTKYNNVVADPQFVNPAADDYHLKPTSPAIDKGANSALDTYKLMTSTALSGDFDGNPRIQDATGNGCSIDIGAFEVSGANSICSLTETLTSSPNPSNYGQNVTITATLTSGSGTPTGSVQFTDGGTVLATALVSTGGVATYSTSGLSTGTHSITATYVPTGSFPSATKTISHVVNGYTTATSLTCTPQNANFGNLVTLAASVTSPSGTPTGNVQFTLNGQPLSTQTLVNGGASTVYRLASAGTQTFTATFPSSGAFNGSTGTCSIAVPQLIAAAGLTIASPPPFTFGSALTLRALVGPLFSPNAGSPTGNVTFLSGGVAVGTATLNNGVATIALNALPGGTDLLSCRYNGDTNYAPTNCNSVSVLIAPVATTTVITAAPNPSYVGQQVQLQTTVTSSAPISPAGTVTLIDGTNSSLGTLALDSLGKAVFSISNLAVGTHPLSVHYTPASLSFLQSRSGVINQVVGPSDFSLSLSPQSLTIKAGAIGSTQVQLASIGVLAGPLTLTNGTLPLNASATFSPATVTLAAGRTGTSTFTINTQGPFPKTASLQRRSGRSGYLVLAACTFSLPWAFLYRRFSRLLPLLGILAVMAGLTGCTTLYTVAPLVIPGTYTVPITATDSKGNAHTANLTLIVTP